MESYRGMAKRLAEELNGFWVDQYRNPNNPDIHYKTTGPEIWRQMDSRIDYLFLGVGTGGTVTGSAKFLKENNPNVKIVGEIFNSRRRSRRLRFVHP